MDTEIDHLIQLEAIIIGENDELSFHVCLKNKDLAKQKRLIISHEAIKSNKINFCV